MRHKWSVKYHGPVKRNGRVMFTTPKYTNRFRSKSLANIVYWFFKLYCIVRPKHRWVWLSYIPKFSIDTELGIDYQDVGPWRSYHLETSGDTKEELLKFATVAEIDQDGGELNCYSLEDAPNEVFGVANYLIHKTVMEATEMGAILYRDVGGNNGV